MDEMGDSSAYLSGILHILQMPVDIFQSEPPSHGHYGPTRVFLIRRPPRLLIGSLAPERSHRCRDVPSVRIGTTARVWRPKPAKPAASSVARTCPPPCTLALIDVPSVSPCSWPPGRLVRQSKPHVRPSPQPVRQHGTPYLTFTRPLPPHPDTPAHHEAKRHRFDT